jgi:DNA-directed RNA polymerase specialized sigma24 family protein
LNNPTIQGEFRKLLCAAETESVAASQQIFDLYGKHILRAVRASLNSRLRRLFDSQDLVQSVWRSIVESRDSLGSFDSSQDMIAFLTTVARRKVAYKVRRHLGQVVDAG